MKGIIVINPFLVPAESVHFAERLKHEFDKKGVKVNIESDLFSKTCLNQTHLNYPLDKVDFCIYLDKDKYQSQILEKSGIRLFNSHSAIRVCDDKAETYIALAGSGVKMPKTVFGALCYNPNAKIDKTWVDNVINELGFPVIVKECYGSMGKGVYLANDEKELMEIMQSVKCKPHIFQQYVSTEKGVDVRVIVIGRKAKCAIRRENECDFRSNVAQGGRAVAFDLPESFKKTAEKCADVLGLDYCGVDLLFDKDGVPVVCEVNSNAFIGGVEGATGYNVAGAYAEHVINEIEKN